MPIEIKKEFLYESLIINLFSNNYTTRHRLPRFTMTPLRFCSNTFEEIKVSFTMKSSACE